MTTEASADAGKGARWEPFPEIDLRQLRALTDDTGIFQHAQYAVPDPHHGYCIDDNARALIAGLLHAQLRGYDEQVVPIQRYLSFLVYAFNPETGKFRNFMGYDRRWLEPVGSQDSQGRTIWALGLAAQTAPLDTLRDLASDLFRRALGKVEELAFLRSKAFAVLGLDAYLQHEANDHAQLVRDRFANELYEAWREHADDDWPWWEDTVTYDNAKLSHALLVAGQSMGRPEMVEAGLKSLRWLLDVQRAADGHLSIIGNQGWLKRGAERAPFDQQPLEAYALVDGCLTAAQATGEQDWADEAWRCFEWFRGRNDLSVSLYHDPTGGCQDGLEAGGPNANQGAESSLAYLLSVLELHRFREQRRGRIAVAGPKTLGYAIVGVSKFARFCLDNYGELDGLKPVAVWNRTTSKAKQLADERGLKAYDTLEQMFDDPSVHVVHIATIPSLHAEQAIAALRRGKHVLCEKPLATNLVDAQQMIQAAAERDRQLGVNFMMRYGPLALPVRELLKSGVLGSPIRGAFTNRAGDAGLPKEHWFWDEQQSGGIFIEHGVHFFDLVGWWLGDSDAQVQHATRLRRPNADVIDQVTCEARYGQQTTVSYYHGFLQPTPLDEQDFRLVCERGQLTLRGWVAHTLEVEALLDESGLEQLKQLLPGAAVTPIERLTGDAREGKARWHDWSATGVYRVNWQPEGADGQHLYGQALRTLMNDLIDAIRQPGHRPRVNAADGRAALEMAVNADRHAKGMGS
ncbi:Gfo/Idh/MocA family oxidoreductase [Phycisphaerales bacterium AB-hyl4]|uniref:Gfo/Idh/MocA family oxidoreductase n=1 Tax=Natronomicrosphaera hydrolytica TaxID=3242702 RepID=A0ABV4U3F5_9BACT